MNVYGPAAHPSRQDAGRRVPDPARSPMGVVRLPLLWLLVALAGYAVYIMETVAGLPDCVATHFGASGAANGWMSRDGYRTFMLIFGLATAAFPLLVGLALRSTPARFINLPHRDYWLAPERREQTTAWLRGHMSWLCILLLLFVSAIHWTVVVANRRNPPWLDPRGALGVVIVLVVMVLVWTGVMVVRFGRKPRSVE